MKNKYVGIALASFMAMSTAHAEDVASVLAVTGTVTATSDACQIVLNKSSVNLTADTNNIIKQGEKATSISPIQMQVWAVNDNNSCASKLWKGKIAVRFVGTHDNADGTTFINTESGEDAASGVGIGFFETNNTPIDINQPYSMGEKSNSATKFIGLQLVELNGQKATKGKVTGEVTFQIERL